MFYIYDLIIQNESIKTNPDFESYQQFAAAIFAAVCMVVVCSGSMVGSW